MQKKSGFTLVEMSVVLVVIGLVVVGVLAGQSLIGSAKISNSISQLQNYDRATETFRLKYQFLPGDIPNDQASSAGLVSRIASPARGQANGDGILEGYQAVANWPGPGLQQSGELLLYWRDLSESGMIKETFNTATDADDNYTVTQIPSILPSTKLGDNNNIVIGNIQTTPSPTGGATKLGKHMYFFFRINDITAACCAGTVANGYYSISPSDAAAFDKKIDDGKPWTGQVSPRGWPSYGEPTGMSGLQAIPYENSCTILFTDQYNVSSNALDCALTVYTSW